MNNRDETRTCPEFAVWEGQVLAGYHLCWDHQQWGFQRTLNGRYLADSRLLATANITNL